MIGFLRSRLNHRFDCCLALRAAPLMGKQQSLCELWVMATQHGISFLVRPNFGLFLVTLFKQKHPLFSESVNQCKPDESPAVQKSVTDDSLWLNPSCGAVGLALRSRRHARQGLSDGGYVCGVLEVGLLRS